MPEAITAENELELLKPFIEKKFGFETPTLHPLAKQIQELSIQNPNITINDIVNDMSSRYIDSSQMDADDLIRFDLLARHGAYDEEKNKNGFTEDDIKEYIAKMTKVEKLEASQNIKKGIDSYNESIKAEYDKELEAKREEQINTIIQNVKTGVSRIFVPIFSIYYSKYCSHGVQARGKESANERKFGATRNGVFFFLKKKRFFKKTVLQTNLF